MTINQYGNKTITNITHLNQNTEWQVYQTCALHKVIETNEGLFWWVTSYVIYIERHTVYHIYNLLLPCIGKYIDFKSAKMSIYIILFESILI
jgi:hypothetical protein